LPRYGALRLFGRRKHRFLPERDKFINQRRKRERVIIGGVGALIAKFAGASTLGFAFYLGLATTLVGGIIQLIAGINGVKHCNKPENAKKCITWGIIVIALAVISSVLEVIGGGKFNVLSFVIGLIVPGLYIYGAFLNHKENAR
jgi:multisubunit Na+/H+ antiporter MnhG subunit